MIALLGSPALAQPKQPAAPVIARVVKAVATGDTTLMITTAGTAQGLTRESTCVLIDTAGEPLPNVACTLLRIDKETSLVKAKVTVDQAKTTRVRFTP